MALISMTMEEKNEFYAKNVDLIHSVTHEYDNSCYPYEDRFQTACVGFTKALNTYDNERGAKLTTYAVTCMKNELGGMFRRDNAECRSGKTIVSIDATMSGPLNSKVEHDHYEVLRADIMSIEDAAVISAEYDETRKVMKEVLSPEQQHALMLFSTGFSYEEIADDLSDTLENVRKLVRSARYRLRCDPRIHR